MEQDQLRTIILVEDKHPYKATLTRQLKRRGFHVEMWGCGLNCKICNPKEPQEFSEAPDFIKRIAADPKFRIVAIVLDVNQFDSEATAIKQIMPKLRADTMLAKIPVIMYSKAHIESLEDEALDAGAVQYYDRYNTRALQAAEIIDKNALP